MLDKPTIEKFLAKTQAWEKDLSQKLGLTYEMFNIFQHRKLGFASVFDFIKNRENKEYYGIYILQTGLTRKINMSDGCFDLFLFLFDNLMDSHLYYKGVDIDQSVVDFSSELMKDNTFNDCLYTCDDSIAAMKEMVAREDKFNIIYLDSYDFDWVDEGPSQIHQLEEAKLADQLLRPGGYLLLDDIGLEHMGKGGLSIPWILSTGRYELVLLDYQALFKKIK